MNRTRENNPMWRRHHTPTTKAKMSKTALQRWRSIREAVYNLDDRIYDAMRRELKKECFVNNNDITI